MKYFSILFVWLAFPGPLCAANAAKPEPSYRGKSLTLWLHALNEPNAEIRIRAAGAIAQMGFAARSAAPALAELLKDPDSRVRAESARALNAMGAGALPAFSGLMAALTDPEPQVQELACDAVGNLGPDARDAIPNLAHLAAMPNPDIATAASAAMARIGPAAVASLTRSLSSPVATTRARAAAALGAIGPGAAPAIPQVMQRLEKDEDPAVRAAAAEALGAAGPPAVKASDALIGALKDPNDEVRLKAAQALGRIGPAAATALPMLGEMLRDSNVSIRISAAADLWAIGRQAQAAVPILVAASGDPDSAVRAAALDALGQMQAHSPTALGALVTGLGDVDVSVRTAAMRALGQIGAGARAAADGPLREMLKDPHAEIRLLSARALWRVDSDPEELLPTLLDAIRDKSWAVRDGAVTLLGEMGPPAASAAETARALLDDPVAYVQVDAALAVWRITGDLNDVLPLISGIIRDRDNDPYLRQLAIAALGAIGPPAREAITVLMDASKDEYFSVRTAAEDAMPKVAAANSKSQAPNPE